MLLPSSFRSRVFLLPLVILLSLAFLLYQCFGFDSPEQVLGWSQLAKGAATPSTSSSSPPAAADNSAFWTSLSEALVEADPQVDMPAEHIEALINSFANLPKGSHGNSQSLVELSEDDVRHMQVQHALFVDRVSSPDFPSIPYQPDSQGIVTSADTKLLPVLVVSLRMLRRGGSSLPVEVFLEDETKSEETDRLCESVLPQLDARCVWISSATSLMELPHAITRFQVKAFALLLSSFQRVLWLDADNWPLHPPETLFSSEPFLSTGLITWPDYWANTASPHFFAIASIPTPSTLSSVASSESGQVMLCKSTHRRTLLLIAYYNYYGPSHFYTLLSQGAMGEGDKETFLAAAHALAAPYYAVTAPPAAVGYHSKESGFHGTATSQADPRLDAEIAGSVPPPPPASVSNPKNKDFFMHCQTIKTEPILVAQKYRDEVRGRMWGSPEYQVERFGYDAERRMWEEIRWTACDMLAEGEGEGGKGGEGGGARKRRSSSSSSSRRRRQGEKEEKEEDDKEEEAPVFSHWRSRSRKTICGDVRHIFNVIFDGKGDEL